MNRALRSCLLAVVSILLVWPGSAAGQTYPARPVRVIVPTPPGNTPDIVGRLLAQKLSERLGQQVFVDNRPGASGLLGMELAARAAPDGYTHLVTEELRLRGQFAYLHVPYKGTTQVATAVMSGQIDAMIGGFTGIAPYVRSGRLRLIAITSPARIAYLPDVPTIAETVPGYVSQGGGTATSRRQARRARSCSSSTGRSTRQCCWPTSARRSRRRGSTSSPSRRSSSRKRSSATT